MKLTAETLQGAYEFLCTCRPFSGWNLPPGDDVKFSLLKTASHFADYCRKDGVHHIRISQSKVKSAAGLIKTMAHEMIHLYMEHHNIPGKNTHGKAFNALADKVCAELLFDRGEF